MLIPETGQELWMDHHISFPGQVDIAQNIWCSKLELDYVGEIWDHAVQSE